MSLSLTALGVKSMTASYANLQTVGHNIANAGMPGYSRQQVNLATSDGLLTGQGFIGRGVDVVSITRKHSDFLSREAINSTSVAAMDAKRLEHLNDLESVFRIGETGLGHSVTQLMSSLVDLSSNPSDLATRQVVLARAGEMASRFSDASATLDEAQTRVTGEVTYAVQQVNDLLANIAHANERVAAMTGAGQIPNDLLDERDRFVDDLSKLMRVTQLQGEGSMVNLYTLDGQSLVLGRTAITLKVLEHESDPSRVAVGFEDFGLKRVLNENTLGGGEIAGMLQFQNSDLVTGRNLIGRLAASVAEAVNAQQVRGLNLQNPLGQVPSQALFGMGPALALPYQTNAVTSPGVYTGSVSITITDPELLQASDYRLEEQDGSPGTWQLTRLADGRVTAVADGDTVDGVLITFGAPPPQAGDRYLLQPVARAASGMQRLLNDPRDLAAALPVVASTGAANTGTVSVAAIQVDSAILPVAGATANISFTSDTGDYNWTLVDAFNAPLASGSGTWTPGQPLPAPPADINGFQLRLQGVPRTGDTITVTPTPASAIASNNGNALQLLALRDANITDGRSPGDAWALAVSEVGVRTQSAKTSSTISQAVASAAKNNLTTNVGVNLDEEAAALIQYQQSYQAAAKVLQVAQALFDSLMQATGR